MPPIVGPDGFYYGFPRAVVQDPTGGFFVPQKPQRIPDPSGATSVLSVPSWQNDLSHNTVTFLNGNQQIKLVPPDMLCWVGKVGQKLRIQHKKSSGSDGGNVALRGLEIPKFMIEVHIYTLEGEQTWNVVKSLLVPRKATQGDERVLYGIQHPRVNSYGIDTVNIEGIEEELKDGALIGEIHCWGQFQRPAPSTIAKKKNATTSQPTVTPGQQVEAPDLRRGLRPKPPIQ